MPQGVQPEPVPQDHLGWLTSGMDRIGSDLSRFADCSQRSEPNHHRRKDHVSHHLNKINPKLKSANIIALVDMMVTTI